MCETTPAVMAVGLKINSMLTDWFSPLHCPLIIIPTEGEAEVEPRGMSHVCLLWGTAALMMPSQMAWPGTWFPRRSIKWQVMDSDINHYPNLPFTDDVDNMEIHLSKKISLRCFPWCVNTKLETTQETEFYFGLSKIKRGESYLIKIHKMVTMTGAGMVKWGEVLYNKDYRSLAKFALY